MKSGVTVMPNFETTPRKALTELGGMHSHSFPPLPPLHRADSTMSPFSPSTVSAPSSGHKMNFEFNLEDHIKKTRQAAKYLRQICHSKKCDGTNCFSPLCYKTREILKHVYVCVEKQNCLIPGCQTTTRLLNHSETCHYSWYNLQACTTAQKDFCLLCTIAFSANTDTNRTPTKQPSYSYEDSEDYNDKPSLFPIIVSDEFMEFSRIPFQATQLMNIHPMLQSNSILFYSSPTHQRENELNTIPSPARPKTYSDSNFAVPNEPNKKQRSKSWAVPGYYPSGPPNVFPETILSDSPNGRSRSSSANTSFAGSSGISEKRHEIFSVQDNMEVEVADSK
jgi:hypothetical protein